MSLTGKENEQDKLNERDLWEPGRKSLRYGLAMTAYDVGWQIL